MERRKKYTEKALQETRAREQKHRAIAIEAANEAHITLVQNPPATANLPQTKDADRQFRRSDFYTNLFGWVDDNGQKKTPALHFIREVKRAIVSPNPEFDQLKKDLESLSCGKRFPNPKDGGAPGLAKWVEYKIDWEITREGISGNPSWTRESLGPDELEDLVQEANEVFSDQQRKAQKQREREQDGNAEELGEVDEDV